MSSTMISATDNPKNVPHEDDSRWDGPASNRAPEEVTEAREREAAAKAEVVELVRLVESGDDLSAEDRIPAAKQAAESAERIRKGVERQAHKAAQAKLEERVDEFKQTVVAARGRNDEQVGTARADAADALAAYVAKLAEANTDASRLASEVTRLRSAAEEFPEFSDGRLRTAASMVRDEQSAVLAVAELVVRILRPVVEDGPEPARRERELYEITRAYVSSESATLQGLLRTLPGKLGHVSYGG